VHDGHALAPALRQLECRARDTFAALPRDAAHGNGDILGHQHLAASRLHVAVGVKALGVLARDHEIEFAAAQLKSGIGTRRPDIGEQVEALAQRHRWVDLAARRVFELKCVGRPEHDAVRAPRLLNDVRMDGMVARLQAGVADRRLLKLQPEREACVRRFQDRERRGGDFRPDPVARENEEVH
jgi:hypothetical protein